MLKENTAAGHTEDALI